MREAKRVRIYYEGDDDRAALRGLQSAHLIGEICEIATRNENFPGQEGMVRDLLPFVSPANGVGGSAIALADLDDLDSRGKADWFRSAVEGQLAQTHPKPNATVSVRAFGRLSVLQVAAGDAAGQAVLIPLGLPEEPLLRQHGIDRFAMDDYVLRLAWKRNVYETVTEFKEVPYVIARDKLTALTENLRENQIAVRHSKRLLHLLRAVTGFRASPAEFIRRLMEQASSIIEEEKLRKLFDPLVGDLEQAVTLLHR
jgi:hypothetical protein